MSLAHTFVWQIRIRDMMAAIGLVAVACQWPIWRLPFGVGALFLLFNFIHERLGARYSAPIAGMVIAGVVVGLFLSSHQSACPPRRAKPLPVPWNVELGVTEDSNPPTNPPTTDSSASGYPSPADLP